MTRKTKPSRAQLLVGGGVLLGVSLVPAYFVWDAVRHRGATEVSTCVVTATRATPTEGAYYGSLDVTFVHARDGVTVERTETIGVDEAGPIEARRYFPKNEKLCFFVPGRPDLVRLVPVSTWDWAVPLLFTVITLAGAATLIVPALRGGRRQ